MNKLFRKGFINELIVLVLPIVLQNLITSAVSMADVVMLGQVDQTALSASSLAGQVQFLLNIVYFGLASALTILASQYWGKRDTDTIARILGIGVIISIGVSFLAGFLALCFPQYLIRIWTNVPELVEAGGTYLRYAALSYVFCGISQPYLAIMKSCERVKKSTFISITAFLSNVVLNALLIFGLFGLPKLGIIGAALATTISRGIETVLCGADFLTQKMLPKSVKVIFSIPKELVADFIRYSLPALLNDMIWALAYNMNSVIMGHLGSDIVAANSVAAVARDLVTTVGFGLSAASSIMIGKEVGAGHTDMARKDADSVMVISLLATIVQGLVLLAVSPLIPGMVKISETAVSYLRGMLMVSVFYQMGQVINTVMIASLFRCGGDSKYGLRLDTLSMWGFAVPLGLVSAFVLKLPPMIVYLCMCTDEFFKMPFALYHYFKTDWLHNLTRDF